MKIDFNKIPVKNIEGEVQFVQIAKQLGNALYMQGHNIEECELGQAIYHADGEVDINETQAGLVKLRISNMPYIIRSAIESLLTEKKD